MPDKIRILYMIDSIHYGAGGTETQLLRIIKSLDRERYDVRLIVLMETPWYKETNNANAQFLSLIPIYKFRKIGTYFNIIDLYKYIRKLNPHIVHTFFPTSNIIGVITAKIAGVHSVLSSRRDYGEWMNTTTLLLTMIANTCVDKIVTNSQAVKDLTHRVEHVRDSKIEVIYNGIDIMSIKTEISKIRENQDDIRKELNVSPDCKIIGIIANLRKMKRIDTLLYAAREITSSNHNVLFVIVGPDPKEDTYVKMARALGIQEIVYFAGRRFDVFRYICAFDVAINCSEKEGLSNAIIEYLVAGIPVVASEAGGNTELIKDGINGFTFKVGDYKTLAEKILILLNDKDCKYKNQFKQNSTLIIEQMDIRLMTDNFDKYYMNQITKN